MANFRLLTQALSWLRTQGGKLIEFLASLVERLLGAISRRAHLSPAALLAWIGIFQVIAVLSLTLTGLVEILPIWVDWTLVAYCVLFLPAGGRAFTTMCGFWARKAHPHNPSHETPSDALRLQIRGIIVITTCVVTATLVTLTTNDIVTRNYWNLVVLGIGTNLVMIDQALQSPRYESPPSKMRWLMALIAPLMLVIALICLLGISANIYIAATGTIGLAHFQQFVKWLGDESTFRSLDSISYDVFSYILVGFATYSMAVTRGWPKNFWQWCTGATWVVLKSGGFLLLWIWAGGKLSALVQNGYLAQPSVLPVLLHQYLSVTAISRGIAYPVGGVGAAWVSGIGALLWFWSTRFGKKCVAWLVRGRRVPVRLAIPVLLLLVAASTIAYPLISSRTAIQRPSPTASVTPTSTPTPCSGVTLQQAEGAVCEDRSHPLPPRGVMASAATNHGAASVLLLLESSGPGRGITHMALLLPSGRSIPLPPATVEGIRQLPAGLLATGWRQPKPARQMITMASGSSCQMDELLLLPSDEGEQVCLANQGQVIFQEGFAMMAMATGHNAVVASGVIGNGAIGVWWTYADLNTVWSFPAGPFAFRLKEISILPQPHAPVVFPSFLL